MVFKFLESLDIYSKILVDFLLSLCFYFRCYSFKIVEIILNESCLELLIFFFVPVREKTWLKDCIKAKSHLSWNCFLLFYDCLDLFLKGADLFKVIIKMMIIESSIIILFLLIFSLSKHPLCLNSHGIVLWFSLTNFRLPLFWHSFKHRFSAIIPFF